MEQSTGCGCTHHGATPTEILSDEHRVIERVLNVLEQLTKRPAAASLNHWNRVLEFFRHFADQCHHCKEEKVLFPALEEHGIPREGGPIGMMLLEHEQGRTHVRSMSDAVERLHTDHHAADELLSHARAFVTLLREHIQKEDDILFRIADETFAKDEQAQLLKGFEAHEAQEVGPGAHEKYLKLARELENELGE